MKKIVLKNSKNYVEKQNVVNYGIALIKRGYNKRNPHIIQNAMFDPMKLLENDAK